MAMDTKLEMDTKKALIKFLPSQFDTVIKEIRTEQSEIIFFKIEIKCEANEFEIWKKHFELLTDTHHNVRKDTKNGRLYTRNLIAVCHHKTRGVEILKHRSKNTECPGKLSMRNFKPRLPDEEVTNRTEVEVRFNHNHTLTPADVSRFRKTAVSAKFYQFFENDYTLKGAIETNEFDIILQNVNNFKSLLADENICPTYSWIYRKYKKWAGGLKSSMKEKAERMLEVAQEKKCEAALIIEEENEQIGLILVTEMMRRVSQLPESSEVCFIDSSGVHTIDGARFFFILCNTPVGGIPIGAILISSDSEDLLTEAFQIFQQMLPALNFGDETRLRGPKIFMIDDCAAERDVLRTVFPKSAMVLSPFHVQQTIWKWFCDRKHNFTLQDHIYIFGLIKNVLAAQSKAELEHFYASFIQDDVVTNYPEVAQYFSMYYGRREEWALYYRKNLFQCEVTELYECAMEVMKDFILQRVKKFNIIQLADFIINRFDLYFEQKLLNKNFDELTKHLLSEHTYFDKTEDVTRNFVDVSGNIFSGKQNIVNMNLACCTCVMGRDGYLCKHQLALQRQAFTNNTERKENDPRCLPEYREYLYYIATGKDIKSEGSENVEMNFEESQDSSQEVVEEDSEGDSEMSGDVVITVFAGQSELNDELKNIFNDLSEKLQTQSDIFVPAIQTFVERYKSLKRDKNIVAALRNFGSATND